MFAPANTSPASARSRRLSQFPNQYQQSPLSGNSPKSNMNGEGSGSRRTSKNFTPLSTPPSLSASVPFDWEAAKNNLPAPYGTPSRIGKKPRPSRLGDSSDSPKTERKRVVRKRSLYERITSLPSRIMFEIALFPHNLPLPRPKTLGRALGVTLHVIHLLVKWSRRNLVAAKEDPDDLWKSEVDWSTSFDDLDGRRGWNWSTPIAFLLLIVSILNALYLFTRIRIYHLHLRNELVQSPHASLVSQAFLNPPPPPTVPERLLKAMGHAFRTAWRLVLGTSPAPEDIIPIDLQPGSGKVQQLDVWYPGDTEMALFTVYSPAHFLAWTVFSSANWLYAFLLLGLISLQIHALMFSYEALVKDRAILSAEVMHEYDAKFVNPRVHPLKKDASVMTHQAEIVEWK